MRDYSYTEEEIEDMIYSDILLEQEQLALHESENEYWNSRCREEFSNRILSGDWT